MEQVFIGASSAALAASTTKYSAVQSHSAAHANEHWTVMPASGTITDWAFVLSAAPGAGYTHTITVRLNGADQFSETISDTDTQVLSATDLAVSAGDLVSVKYVGGAVGATGADVYLACRFTATAAQTSVVAGGSGAGTVNAGAARYGPCWGHGTVQTSEVNARQTIPTGGTLKNLYVALSVDPGDPGGPDGYSFTLTVNGSASALTATIYANDTAGNDTANTVSVSAGDMVSIAVAPLNAPASAPRVNWGMVFEPTVDGESLILGGTGNNMSISSTEYNKLGGFLGTWGGAEATHYSLGLDCTLRKFAVNLAAAPGAGKSYTLTVRDDGADTSLAVTIADTDTYGIDSSNSAAVVDLSLLAVKSAPSGSPLSTDAYWGCVCYIAPAGGPAPRRVMTIS